MLHASLRTGFAVLLAIVTLSGCTKGPYTMLPPRSAAQERDLPAMVVTDEPVPDVIYRRGSHDTVLANTSEDTGISLPSFNMKHVETMVTQKAQDLSHDLEQLQENTESSTKQMKALQTKGDKLASEYYALVASISSDLQTGTTAGNPILLEKWNTAQDRLDELSRETSQLNSLATDLSYQASKASFLLESTRAAFSLSGAVDEDHRKLTEIEDGVNRNIVSINRLMTKVNDELNRRSTYLRTERANLQTLSLGIANGELYGQSLTNSFYKKSIGDSMTPPTGAKMASASPAGATQGAPSTNRRPLVIIRFDHPNVSYDQPLYTAISQALEKYPAAKFDLVAVSPSEGNPAQLSIASSEARKNGEAVLRSLTQMGLPIERIRLNAANSKDVVNSEVHIYIQ